jgi:hypothetical protein
MQKSFICTRVKDVPSPDLVFHAGYGQMDEWVCYKKTAQMVVLNFEMLKSGQGCCCSLPKETRRTGLEGANAGLARPDRDRGTRQTEELFIPSEASNLHLYCN